MISLITNLSFGQCPPHDPNEPLLRGLVPADAEPSIAVSIRPMRHTGCAPCGPSPSPCLERPFGGCCPDFHGRYRTLDAHTPGLIDLGSLPGGGARGVWVGAGLTVRFIGPDGSPVTGDLTGPFFAAPASLAGDPADPCAGAEFGAVLLPEPMGDGILDGLVLATNNHRTTRIHHQFDEAPPPGTGKIHRRGADDPHVFRRGTRPKLELRFENHPGPSPEAGSYAAIELSNRTDPSIPSITLALDGAPISGWRAVEVGRERSGQDTLVRVELTIPPGAPIGLYDHAATLSTCSPLGDYARSVGTLYVVFNPYTEEDDAYVPAGVMGGPDIAEHIENEYGTIWVGSAQRTHPRPWIYHQFELGALAETVEALAKARRRYEFDLGSPTAVARALTWAIGDPDQGILRGRWDGDYSDGHMPWYWPGSLEVFQSYNEEGRNPVKYGQCWVFAGLLTTASRTIGIASRPVTNFNSAHERRPFNQACDDSWTLNPDDSLTRDAALSESIWSFHAWAESWFRRPDLSEHGVWQAYDATPMERSGAQNEPPGVPLFRCGPASVARIRDRDPQPKFDTDFIAGETNAEVMRTVRRDGIIIDHRPDPGRIGQRILTSGGASGDPLDVTGAYKTPNARADCDIEDGPFSIRGECLASPTDAPEWRLSGGPLGGTGEAPLRLSTRVIAVGNNGSFLRVVVPLSVETLTVGTGESWSRTIAVPVGDVLDSLRAGGAYILEVGIVNLRDNTVHPLSHRTALPSLTGVSIDAPTMAVVGDVVNCRVLVTNPLPVPLADLRVLAAPTASLGGVPAERTAPLLAPGQTMLFEYQFPAIFADRAGIAVTAVTTLGELLPAWTGVLVIDCPGDFNQDGGIDGADVEAFFGTWESGSPEADINQDGGIDGSDVDFFFAFWEQGC